MSRGKITVGLGTIHQKDLEIVDFVQAQYKDHRLISISQIEDGSLIAVVENPASSGRSTQSTIWLTKESFVAMISTAFLYFSAKGESLGELMKDVVEKQDINYKYSDNLDAIKNITDQPINLEEESPDFIKTDFVFVRYLNWSGVTKQQAIAADSEDDAREWLRNCNFKEIQVKQIYFKP